MARRALRIFPLYYLTLGVIFMVLPLLGLQPQIYQAEAPQQVWLWTYLDNWASPMGWGTGALPHFWSLAVEEQFYLVWPLIVLAMASVRSVAYIAIALALISLVSRVWLWQTGHSTEEIYQWTICRLDALCLGALAAACWRDPAWRHRLAQTAMPLGWLTAGLFIVGALITKGYPRSSPMGQTLGYAILSIVFSVGVYAAACRDVSGTSSKTALFVWHRLLQHPALRRLGQYSYGIYVMHKPMHDLLSKPLLRLLHWQPAAHIGVALAHIGLMLALSYGAAVLSYHLYEVHFLRLKNLFD
jgi:peptidoglycan/LPS O-acetylase OafA/YrhL